MHKSIFKSFITKNDFHIAKKGDQQLLRRVRSALIRRHSFQNRDSAENLDGQPRHADHMTFRKFRKGFIAR